MSFRKFVFAVGALLIVELAAHGELDKWVGNVEAGGKLEGVFFRAFQVGAGTVIGRRSPRETRAELSKMIEGAPAEAELLSLRALEAEKQLDFPAAQADWIKYGGLLKDKPAAAFALADYYHRRLMPREEIAALRGAVRVAPAGDESARKAFQRMAALVDEQALDGAFAGQLYQDWVAFFPKDADLYRRACLTMIAKKQYAVAEQILAAYEKAFPGLVEFPTEARAGLELAKGSAEKALAVYEKSFQPLWPEPLAAGYFALLEEEGRSRKFVDQTRARIVADPADLGAAARLFYYFRAKNDSGSAARVLVEFRKRKTSAWTPAEHETLATLFDRTNRYDDAARHYHALYMLRPATAVQTEFALAGLVDLLLNAAEQPIGIGAGDLSYYRDIAAIDRSPGYLNGVLSLLLNSQNPSNEYGQQSANAVAYFHRVKAAELDGLFEQRFPKSERRAGLRAKLIQAYATYGDTKAVVDNGRLFLTAFANSPQRMEVALLMADGYARLGQTENEFELYRQLLVDLAAQAGGTPIGTTVAETPVPTEQNPAEDRATRLVNKAAARTAKPDAGVRSQDYVRVLDRYLARLVSLNRMTEALRVYRGELTRNASDPGLYERFAAFLEQNKLGAEIERVYRDAMQRFPDDTEWSQKLARWYLRGRQAAKYSELTRQVTKVFSGSDLETYFAAVDGPAVGAQLYLQLNQYAHQRFPHNLAFIRNLLNAYKARGTANPVAYEALLRENWVHAPDLRSAFFELLSRTRRLDKELAALRTAKPDAEANPAAARMLAEGEVWKTNYEAAAAPLRALAVSLPAETAMDQRAASLQRSLGRADLALEIESNLANADPRSREVLTRIGEIEADREQYGRAAEPWNKMTLIEPGKLDGYLDAATVFWDYFQFNDALKVIERGRVASGIPALYAYEAGAIRENQRDYAGALNEYAKGALAEGAGRCRDRLLRLAKRPSLAAQAEAITARLGASQNLANVTLRIGYLEGQGRAADLQRYLSITLAAATSTDLIALLENSARASEMQAVLQRVIERRIAIISDPVELLRARMELARYFESRGDQAQAAQVVDALYRENPAVFGVIRNAVNYYVRNKQVPRAVELLVASADRAQQPYQDRFRFEAAQKALESGAYDRGQQLITALLDKEPYRADYLALAGNVYERRGDDAGLRTYYVNTIASLQKSTLSAEDKIARVASLRRAFAGVLVRVKDYAGAADQYIEVINRYPDDEGLVREAALFALQNGQRARLTDAYVKTAAASSRDYRWPIVLSRIETVAENFPAALEWLGKARAIRPERADFLAAKGPLEERLMRFEDAAKTYANLWELSYHDPSWMVKCGEQYERLGRHADAISAIKRAFIEGRPESPANYLLAATQANAWNELDAAQDFLTKGKGGNTALAGVLAARRHVALPTAVADAKWGEAVSTYSTPEERAALERVLSPATGMAVASGAGFEELLSRWTPELIDGAANPQWLQLLTRRARFDGIGTRLEAAAKNGTLSGQQRDALLMLAGSHYGQAGNTAAELRLLEQRRAAGLVDGDFIPRYAELATRDSKQALAIAGSDPLPALRDAVANRVLMNGEPGDALATIQARGTAFKPVWTRAYTALAGVYFDQRTPQVRTAFVGVLGPRTVGGQLGHPPNEAEQVAGAPWFYYAARYGEYLNDADFILAELEQSPGMAASYAALGEFYEARGDNKRAMAEYDYVLQLTPRSPGPHVRKAKMLAAGGDAAAAVAEWKLAFAGFEREIDAKPPATWWTEMAATLNDIGQYKAFAAVREGAARVLRAHFKRHGAYNADLLIPGILKASGDAQWLLELSRSAPEPNQVLDAALKNANVDRDLLLAREVENAQAKANATLGSAKTYLQETVVELQLQRIGDATMRGNIAMAERLMQELPAQVVESHTAELAVMQIRIAAKRGTLNELLARYQRDPAHAPADQVLTGAATQLRNQDEKDEANANRVLEYWYTRELANRTFTTPNFLGLAEVKLANNDLPAALELLRRMNLMVGAPFELLNDSASLLARMGHAKEAAVYFDQLVQVQPWEPLHRLHAALTKPGAAVVELSAIVKNPAATYATRVEAARALRKAGGVDALASGVAELDLIAGKGPLSEAQVSKPFYVASRLLAAEMANDAAVRFRLLSAAVSIAPQAGGRPRVRLFSAAVETRRWWLANSLLDENGFDNDAELLRRVIEVKEHVGESPEIWQQKLSALLKDPQKADLKRVMVAQAAEVERRNQNELRRPVVSEAMMPDRVVRPRIGGVR